MAEAFLKDKIAIGHALLIAKLPDSQQQEAFNAAFRRVWTSKGNQQVLIPVRELAAWISAVALAPVRRRYIHVPIICAFGKVGQVWPSDLSVQYLDMFSRLSSPHRSGNVGSCM